MDLDSSSKFIGSLTKFLQSLCNGYVEFQKGVELVGHIYLNIDTGEKVDYILHERVSKNDENSVSFVSNSYHAQPLDKGKATANTDTPSKSGANARAAKESSDDDDDIMIVDHGKGVPGSLNSGSIPSRGMKRAASPTSSQRKPQRPYHQAGSSSGFSQGSSNHPVSSHRPFGNRQHTGPPPTVTGQENLNISDVKLEQITSDELMSLASHVGDERPPGASQSQMSATHSHSQPRDGAMWIKQEAADDEGGGSDAGWSQGKDDSNSNSGSNLHPVMLHQNPAAYSGPVFPGFSGANSSGAPGANPFADPLPGTSQDTGGGLDPSGFESLGLHTPMVPYWSDWGADESSFSARAPPPVNTHHPLQGSRRILLPLRERVALIKASANKTQRQLANEFGISKTQVFLILKRKEQILNMYEKMKHAELQGFACEKELESSASENG